MEDNLRDRFVALAQALSSAPNVVVERTHVGNPIRKAYINMTFEDFGKMLLPESLGVFQEFDGAFLAWKYSTADDEDLWGGEFDIPQYSYLLENPDIKFDLPPFASEGRFSEFELHLFDQYQESLQSTLKVGLELRDGKEHLWLWNDDGEKYPLTLSIQQYFERLLETKGFIGWQYFFVDLDACDFGDPYFSENFAAVPNDGMHRMEEFLEVMPRLFPDADYSFYRERLAFFQEANANFVL
jgi:hypothetical protein